MATVYYRTERPGREIPYLNFSFMGHRYRRSLGQMNQRMAMKILAKIQVSMVLVETGMAQIPKGLSAGEFLFSCRLQASPSPICSPITLRLLVAEYLQAHAPPVKGTNTWNMEKVHLKHFLVMCGNIKLIVIDTTLIEKYRRLRCEQVKPVTINKEIATLRLALSWAKKKGWLQDNPVEQIQPLKTTGGQHPFLTASEIKECLNKKGLPLQQKREILRFRLLDWNEIKHLVEIAWQYDPDLAPLLVTAAYSGLRRGELCHLKWSDLDFKHNVLIARSAKQSRRYSETLREIPLHPYLQEVLLSHKQNAHKRPWVFGKRDAPFTPNMLTYYFHKLLGHTTYQGIGLHSFRHAFASHLGEKGVDQRVIDELMGHVSEQMSRRYRHLFPKNRRSAIEVLSRF